VSVAQPVVSHAQITRAATIRPVRVTMIFPPVEQVELRFTVQHLEILLGKVKRFAQPTGYIFSTIFSARKIFISD
jgi:hypothetical protein